MDTQIITVFVENKQPVEVEVTRTTTIREVLKKLGVSRPHTVWLSNLKTRPSVFTTDNDVFWRATSGQYTLPISEQKGMYPNTVLWVGYNPTGSRPKWYYKWVGNEKREVEYSKMQEDFGKYARKTTWCYSIRDIEARSPKELFELWCKVEDVILINSPVK